MGNADGIFRDSVDGIFMDNTDGILLFLNSICYKITALMGFVR